MKQTKAQKAMAEAEAATLREMLPPGSTVYTGLVHCSRSGMRREITVHAVRDGEIIDLTGRVARVLGDRVGKHGGVTVDGCGMDMGFKVVYDLGRVLWRDGVPCAGETSCQSPDHYQGAERDVYGARVHRDGGYAYRHRWI